jgi:hypothetical protein
MRIHRVLRRVNWNTWAAAVFWKVPLQHDNNIQSESVILTDLKKNENIIEQIQQYPVGLNMF